MSLLEAAENAFTARLDRFQGPLDLLLYLIKQHEVEIEDLPIVEITDQYLAMVDALKTFNPDAASEFVVLAATLIEIKSKTLLPREDVDFSDIEDPRSDLIQQLLAYREFKEKAKDLGVRRQTRLTRWMRGRAWAAEDEAPDDVQLELGDVEVWDLLTMFQTILEEADVDEVPTLLAYDDTPIEVHMHRVIEEICRTPNRASSFRKIVQTLARDRIQLVGLFIALLELTRLKRIRLSQPRDFSDIHIMGADDLDPEEAPTLVGPAEEHFETAPENAEPDETPDNEVVFDLDKTSEDDHALDIEGFYKSNYRADRSRVGEADAAMTGEGLASLEFDGDEEGAPSLDVDEATLEIIRTRIPDVIFDPDADQLAAWRSRRDPDLAPVSADIPEDTEEPSPESPAPAPPEPA